MQLSLNSDCGIRGKLTIGEHVFDVIIDGTRIEAKQEPVRITTCNSGTVGGALCVPGEKRIYIEIRMIAVGLSSTEEPIEQLTQIGQAKRMIDLEG